jgi:hypothetical protein
LTETKLKISVANLEDALASFLIATGVVAKSKDIVSLAIPVKTKDGLVEVKMVTVTER